MGNAMSIETDVDKMVQFTALLFREKTKKLEQQIAAADTEIKNHTLPRREKRVSSPMINCANSVSSHKPFQKGQKSKSNYKYYQKILLDTKYLMKKEEKKEN